MSSVPVTVVNGSIPATVAFSTVGVPCVFQRGALFFIKINASQAICLDPNGSGVTDFGDTDQVVPFSAAQLTVTY
jgi:hypothetical protein